MVRQNIRLWQTITLLAQLGVTLLLGLSFFLGFFVVVLAYCVKILYTSKHEQALQQWWRRFKVAWALKIAIFTILSWWLIAGGMVYPQAYLGGVAYALLIAVPIWFGLENFRKYGRSK